MGVRKGILHSLSRTLRLARSCPPCAQLQEVRALRDLGLPAPRQTCAYTRHRYGHTMLRASSQKSVCDGRAGAVGHGRAHARIAGARGRLRQAERLLPLWSWTPHYEGDRCSSSTHTVLAELVPRSSPWWRGSCLRSWAPPSKLLRLCGNIAVREELSLDGDGGDDGDV